MSQQVLKYSLFIGILAVLTLGLWYVPPLQRNVRALQTPDLGGSFEPAPAPVLTPKSWLSGSYQRMTEQHLKQESALSPFFVRARNQLIYQTFGEVPSKLVTKGQDGYFYSTEYCDAYIGKDATDQAQLEALADQLQRIQRKLQEKGKTLLVLLPPGKPRVLPQFLPEFYQKNGSKFSDYDRFRFLLFEKGVPLQDFAFFFNHDTASDYPLYPQFGLHWSYYGAALATDSIRTQIGALLDLQLPIMQWQADIPMQTDLLPTDRELLYGANLWDDPPIRPMPYPNITYAYQDTIHTRPKVLAVGDSYYKLLYDYGIPQGLFHPNSRFWYYYNTSIPAGDRSPRDENLNEIIEQYDIILLPHAEINIKKFGFGFLEKLEQALSDGQ
jgi:hypothetical protein